MRATIEKTHLFLLFMACVVVCFVPSFVLAEQVDLSQMAPKGDKSKKVSHLVYEVRELSRSKTLSTDAIWGSYRARLIGDSIQLNVVLARDADKESLDDLIHNAGRVQRHHKRSVQMIVPLGNVDWFESQSIVASVDIPNYALPQSVTSEGLDTLGIPRFHSKGYMGRGVKIGVMDGSFKNYLSYKGTELPANIRTKQFGLSFEGDSEHGTQCAQIVYDAAPDAELWLIQIDTQTDFLEACDWIESNSFDVVSVSLAFLNCGWLDGSSSLSKKVEEVRGHGMLWVNSAGNYAEQHWWGLFYDPDGNGFHEFGYLDEGNSISLEQGWEVSFYLTWNDWPYSSNDYDLYLVHSSTGTIVSMSINLQNGFQSPVEAISLTVPVTGNYYLAIRKYSAIGNHWFQLFSPGLPGMQYSKSSYSVPIPGDSKGALTVGAVPWNNTGQIESFSSNGPTEDFRTKPELVAPDKVTVKTITGTTNNTPGTSYSCPHVAGAAAVYLSAKPSVYPPAVIDSFKTMCIDRGSTGPDNTYGWGLLHLRTPNSPPTLVNPGNRTVAEKATLAFALSASDTDGDPLTYSAVPLPNGASFSTSTGNFVWIPAQGQAGTYPITFTVSDGKATDQESITITVTKANRAPVLTNPGNKTVAENGLLAFALSASDPDSDPLTYSANPLPQGASFGSTNGNFVWTPTFEQAGQYQVTFSVSDGQASDQEAVQITVTNVNRPPILTNPGNKTVAENGLLAFALSASDPDSDPLTYSANPLPEGASFSSTNGNFVWTPTFEQAGSYGITFTVSDGQATGQTSITITVNNVNRPPSSFALSLPKNNDTVASTYATLCWRRSIDPDAGDVVRYKLLYAKSEQPLAISHPSPRSQPDDNQPPFNPKEPPIFHPLISQIPQIETSFQSQDSMQLDFNADVSNWGVSDTAWVHYICPGTQCDDCTEQRTPKPSQVYWVDFDSKGSLAFVGNHLGFWNSDCDYEWWQRYTHGALPSTWKNIRSVELRVFNQSDFPVWLAVQYWQAETRQWVFIKNSPSWASLGSRSWTTVTVSDSTGEAITSMDWLSLDFGAWHHEDPIYIDWVRGISSEPAIVWQDSVLNISDTSFVLDNLNQRYHYYWKVIAYDNENASTDCNNGGFSFFAADVTPPSFTIDVLSNPVLPFELDLFLYPSEQLSGLPEVTVTSPSGSSAQVVTQLSNRDAACYLTDYQIAQSGSYTITACGTDLSTNRGCKDANLSASRLFVSSGADLISSSGALRLRVLAGSSRSDGLVFCEERPVSVSDLVDANLPADITPIQVVHLKSTVTMSNKPASLTIDPEVAGFSLDAGRTIVLYPLSNSRNPIPTRVNALTGQCVAEITEICSYLVGSSDIGSLESLPSACRLDQNAPNPFNGSTVIPFSTDQPTHVRLEVFNVLGQKVRTLLDADIPPGNYYMSWNGKTDAGTECSSGAYFCRIAAGSYLETKKMLYLK